MLTDSVLRKTRRGIMIALVLCFSLGLLMLSSNAWGCTTQCGTLKNCVVTSYDDCIRLSVQCKNPYSSAWTAGAGTYTAGFSGCAYVYLLDVDDCTYPTGQTCGGYAAYSNPQCQ